MEYIASTAFCSGSKCIQNPASRKFKFFKMKKFQFSFFGMDEEYEVGKVKEKIWGMEVIKRKLVRVGSREYEE